MLLKYGSSSFTLDIPEERILAQIVPPAVRAEQSAESIISRELDSCLSTISSFRAGEKVLIITSDITRYTASEIYLPLLVERLNRQGIPDRDIEILIALGIHRKQTDAEHRKILGSIYGRVRVTDHECDDPGELVCAGVTSSGKEVWINRRAVEADRLILTGTISFHYFAGFGGGRKSILPGIAGRKSCMESHFAVLNPEPGSGKNPAAATAVLTGNPVHAAMDEACSMVRPDFILNTLLTPDKRVVDAVSGNWRDAHAEGCRRYLAHFSVNLGMKADLVIASCGGFPKDINVIQSHKSMEYASRCINDGGVMILMAECRDGAGNATFFNWFRHRELDEFEAALRSQYEINGQTAYSLLQKAKKFRIILVSSLHANQVKEMGLIPAASLEDALQIGEKLLPVDWKTYVVPEAGSVLPVVNTSP